MAKRDACSIQENVLLYKIGFPEAAVIDRIVAQRAKAGLLLLAQLVPLLLLVLSLPTAGTVSRVLPASLHDATGNEEEEGGSRQPG